MSSPIEIVRRQIAELEAKAKAIEEQKKKYAEFMSLGMELGILPDDSQDDAMVPKVSAPQVSVIPPPPPPSSHLTISLPPIQNAAPRRGSFGAVAEASAELIANATTGHIRTADLIPLLEERGITVGGKSPLAGISAILSKDDRFEPNRKLGWGLKQQTPASAVTDAGANSTQASGLPKPDGTDSEGGF